MRSFYLIGGSAAALFVVIASANGCGDSSDSSSTGPASSTATVSSTSTASASGGGGAATTTTTASTAAGGATTTSTTSTATAMGGGGAGTGGAATGGGGAGGCGASTPVALTVKNFEGWCNVAVNGDTGSSLPSQTVCVADASAVPLSATANAGFELGTTPWHLVDGDTGSGVQGTLTGTGTTEKSAAVETVASAPDCVWICCPFLAGNGCEAAAVGNPCM